MKRIIMQKTTVLFTFCLLWLFSSAQISITQNDMPEANDTIRLSSTVNLGSIDFAQTGPDHSWDFTNLVPLTQSVDTFVSVQQTPWVYQLVFFLSSNLARKLTEFNQFPGFQVTDVYEYYKNSSSDYRSVGYGVTMNGVPIPNKYNQPDKIYQFPEQYGNADSSTASYALDIPGLGYSGGWKKRVNNADGWGTLKTPFGEFQTLRIRSEIYQYDSIYIDSLGLGIPVYRETVEYKWLGNGFGLPLCKVTDDGILPTITYIDSVRNMFVGRSPEYSRPTSFTISPNPAKDHVDFHFGKQFAGNISIEFFSVTGQLVFRQRELLVDNNNVIHVNFAGKLPVKGLYFVRINGNVTSYTTKLLIK